MLDREEYNAIGRASDIVTGKDSFIEGWNAFYRGEHENPYPYGHWRRLDWEDGWTTAEIESDEDTREEEPLPEEDMVIEINDYEDEEEEND